MKVLIAAGGTGGHIYPGIAVANEIIGRDAGSEVLFVGTARGLEKKIVPDSGFQLSLINSAGLKNVGVVGKLKGLVVLPRSFWEARRILKEFAPDVVVGAGGYVSGPVLLTAHFMSIPTMLMESNALPGFTNRRLSRFVDKAALTFEAARPYFGKKAVVTGNPVRKEFFSIGPRPESETINLLVFGGSQGARSINNAVMGALPTLDDDKHKLSITHQTGEADFEKVRDFYEKSGWENTDVRPYITDMVTEFEKADLIISRAGATTCSELAAAGRPAIMMPLRTAADDHQRKNAEAIQAAGAAVMVLDKEADDAANSTNLANAIINLTGEPGKIARMGTAAKSLARVDAAEKTVDLIEELKKNV